MILGKIQSKTKNPNKNLRIFVHKRSDGHAYRLIITLPTPKHKRIVAILSIVVLIVTNSYIFDARAVSLVDASDTLSTSNVSAMATHTINFTSSITLGAGDYFLIRIPDNAGFGDILATSITCPANSTRSAVSTSTAKCTATGPVVAGAQQIVIAGIANPSTLGPQTISAYSYASTSALMESADMVIAIINSVAMSASVPSTLTFSVLPVATGTVINTATTSGGTGTTSINFGSLRTGTSTTLGQELRVTTNAAYGFTVTVQENQPLTTTNGATIDSFKDGVPPGSPIPWAAPSGNLSSTSTYGHMGFTTDDNSLSNGNPFIGGGFTGFVGSSTREVMYNNGPADGSTPSVGSAKVAYRVEITGLQEAGEYSNSIVYIVTPAY